MTLAQLRVGEYVLRLQDFAGEAQPRLPIPADPNPVPVQKAASWARPVWVGVLALAGGLELYGLMRRDEADDTLSETTRWLWRTDTPWGRRLWYVGWTAVAVWFGPHIARQVHRSAVARSRVIAGREVSAYLGSH